MGGARWVGGLSDGPGVVTLSAAGRETPGSQWLRGWQKVLEVLQAVGAGGSTYLCPPQLVPAVRLWEQIKSDCSL